MSFRDLGGAKSSGLAQRQPRRDKDEETSFERSIKANIQEIQDSVRRANEQLEQAQRSFLSKRIGESLDRFLERSQQLSQETERLFRDWTVHLAGEPAERHRKKFSYEKLQKAFEEEVTHLKDAARRTVAAQQEAVHMDRGSTSIECRPICEEQSAFSVCGESDVEHGLLDDSCVQVSSLAQQEDATIRNRIAQEREEGIRRIQSQVHEVNQIFRDLASIVSEQGNEIDSIERTAESASADTKQAALELRKAHDRSRGSRERLCCMLTAAVVLLFLIVLPHMHMSSLHFDHSHASSSSGTAQRASAVPAGSSAASDVAVPVAGWRQTAFLSPSSRGASDGKQGASQASGSSSAGSPPVVDNVT
eukprot:TRINITY_DN28956_c0_g1_i1.p1 TRINITY_DN28956_c0_g1~~TRINITY_DN28956_c0_g1_i1.p1  ORF type:complete len:382 (+),score=87.81 TRINITY_DN28956_c0_g1_i1:58-1146(+)